MFVTGGDTKDTRHLRDAAVGMRHSIKGRRCKKRHKAEEAGSDDSFVSVTAPTHFKLIRTKGAHHDEAEEHNLSLV
jgi:hypothetical protein